MYRSRTVWRPNSRMVLSAERVREPANLMNPNPGPFPSPTNATSTVGSTAGRRYQQEKVSGSR